jgi:hypothetical protein
MHKCFARPPPELRRSTWDLETDEMPEICRFLGIVIYMLYDDHRPPHFHAEYGEYRVTVEIHAGVIQGRFPRRALRSLLEWYELYRDDLLEDWELAEQHEPLNPIPPLE